MPPIESISLTLRLQITFVAMTALLIWRLRRIYQGEALHHLAIGWTIWMLRFAVSITGAKALSAGVPAYSPLRRAVTMAAVLTAVTSAIYIRAGTLSVAGLRTAIDVRRGVLWLAVPLTVLAGITTFEGVPGWWRLFLLLLSSTLAPVLLFGPLAWTLLRAERDDLTTGRQLAAITYAIFAAKQLYNLGAYLTMGAQDTSPSAYSETVVLALVAMGTVALLLERERQRGVQAEREQRRLEIELATRDRLDSLGRLAGGVAHDFNNMLTAILGNAQIAREQLSAADGAQTREQTRELVEELTHIEATATRASAITKQLLTFARRDRIAPSVFNVAGSVERVIRYLKSQHTVPIALQVEIDSTELYVLADPDRVEQAIINLVKNSQDALEGRQGLITVKVDPMDGALDGRDAVRVRVSDTGAGMDAATRSRVFEPFFTTKGQDRGTGLGLSIVHGAVLHAGGRIDIESAPGQGTSVTMLLPRGEAPTQPTPPTENAFADFANTRVLVVDDDPLVRRVVVRILAKHGLRVLEAGDADEAQAIHRAQPDDERIEVLITDLVMPGANGRTLARMLRALDPELLVLYVSGYEADTFTDEPDAPAGIFVAKPFTEARLLSALADALSGSRVPQNLMK